MDTTFESIYTLCVKIIIRESMHGHSESYS